MTMCFAERRSWDLMKSGSKCCFIRHMKVYYDDLRLQFSRHLESLRKALGLAEKLYSRLLLQKTSNHPEHHIGIVSEQDRAARSFGATLGK
jgi:hypothetical protein